MRLQRSVCFLVLCLVSFRQSQRVCALRINFGVEIITPHTLALDVPRCFKELGSTVEKCHRTRIRRRVL